MKINMLTLKDIRATNPCYDPIKYLPEDWTGTVIDILSVEACPPEDRLYVVRKSSQLSDKVLRLFACKAARLAQTYTTNYTHDTRTMRAIEVSEAFANGLATVEELKAARKDVANAADAAYAAYTYAYAADAAANAAYAAATAAYANAAYAADAADAAAAAAAAYAAYANAADAAAYAARRNCRLQLVEILKKLILEHAYKPVRRQQ